jgi:hypothetical protein
MPSLALQQYSYRIFYEMLQQFNENNLDNYVDNVEYLGGFVR